MKTERKQLALFSTLALGGLVVAASSVFAQPRGKEGPPRRPPQEAIDACSESDAGDTCEFEHDGNKVKGVCKAPPKPRNADDKPQGESETTLACAPNRRPPPTDRPPNR